MGGEAFGAAIYKVMKEMEENKPVKSFPLSPVVVPLEDHPQEHSPSHTPDSLSSYTMIPSSVWKVGEVASSSSLIPAFLREAVSIPTSLNHRHSGYLESPSLPSLFPVYSANHQEGGDMQRKVDHIYRIRWI